MAACSAPSRDGLMRHFPSADGWMRNHKRLKHRFVARHSAALQAEETGARPEDSEAAPCSPRAPGPVGPMCVDVDRHARTGCRPPSWVGDTRQLTTPAILKQTEAWLAEPPAKRTRPRHRIVIDKAFLAGTGRQNPDDLGHQCRPKTSLRMRIVQGGWSGDWPSSRPFVSAIDIEISCCCWPWEAVKGPNDGNVQFEGCHGCLVRA